MAKKSIRFNYFSINVCGDYHGVVRSAPWNMTDFFNYLSVTDNFMNGVANVGEYNAELDRTTFEYSDNPELFSIQITKLRDDKLPVIKAIGLEKEDLELNENQYLGEYITIVYDSQLCMLAVQSNLYSLNISQLEIMLTSLRKSYFEAIDDPQELDLSVKLYPLLDPNKVHQVRNAQIFKTISIKGSDVSLEAFERNPTLNRLSEIMGEIEGVKFELKLSVGGGPRDSSLDQSTIRNIIDSFTAVDETNSEKPKIEVKAKLDDESKPEIINLLTPRITNLISLDIPNRQSISHIIIFVEFKEEYQNIRPIISRVITTAQ